MQWEIIHIPVKPSSSIEQSTVDVLSSKIEPELASKFLNQMGPLDILLHVNRVRRSSVKGKIELPAILCLSNENENHKEGMPNNVLQLISAHHLSPFNAKLRNMLPCQKKNGKKNASLGQHPTVHRPSCKCCCIVDP